MAAMMSEMRRQSPAELQAGMAALMNEMRKQDQAEVQAGMAAIMNEMRQAESSRGASWKGCIDERDCDSRVKPRSKLGMAAMMSEMRCALAACQSVGALHRGTSAVTSREAPRTLPVGKRPRGNTSQGTCGWNLGAR